MDRTIQKLTYMRRQHPFAYRLTSILLAVILLIGIPEYACAETEADASGDRSSATETEASASLNILAKSAILMDAASGTVLYEQNAHEKLPPASVTKIMTMLLICEAVDSGKITLEDTVTVSDHAASMGGSQMYMESGEQHTLDELLTGISMVSANDACVAAAEYISGSSDIFVEAMNRRAAELHMEDTHFENTNGLPVANHHSSAYDIAVMSQELLKHSLILPYLSNLSGQLSVGKDAEKKTTLEMANTNKLLRTYSGAIGIKTGFTNDAGYCLSAAANRDELCLISVVLGAESSAIRFSEAARLLDYGYSNYEAVPIAAKDERMGSASVEKGMAAFVDLYSPESIQMLVPKGCRGEISYSVCPKQHLSAPIKKGQTAGMLEVYQKGEPVKKYPLSADRTIGKANIKTLILQSIAAFISG